MALFQFRDEPKGINRSYRIHAPKKHVTSPLAWYKECRERLPTIPDLCKLTLGDIKNCPPAKEPHNHYHLTHQPEVTVRYIKFTIENELGERCHLVIDRSIPAIGGA
jgi:hypothetical protein